ncbi:hypothetical protein [Anaeromyxobacter oryzae]|uniref:Uncharacterized protein n=1 Tax=Anaeromyxobacter oryzae TaxID=2918170 RepID=A0ABM7X136_9BACT|nr:hypothetical protein [Anaeromyxobacter oryzae]BDG05473.1 hypothetical protein AMOR_44690 [Anaeromyxobacter oryzae]
MAGIVVSGRMAVLFDKVALDVGGDGQELVDGYRCRWCDWTYVVDDPKLIPDHECHGASGVQGKARAGA